MRQRLRPMLGLVALPVVAACGMPGTSEPYRVAQNGAPVGMASAASDTFLSFQNRTFAPFRAIDGNPNTEWASTDRDEASLIVRFNQVESVGAVRIKTGPTQGSYYVIEFSDDGQTWRAGSGALTNSTWAMENKPVSGQGAMMRVRWFRNNAPLRHMSVFEVQPYRTGAVAPPVTPPVSPPAPPPAVESAQAAVMPDSRLIDRMGTGGWGADATKDGHLRLTLTLPTPVEVRAIELITVDELGNASGPSRWSTSSAANWLLGVERNGVALNQTYVPSLGTQSGTQTLELFANDNSAFQNAATRFGVLITLGDGRTLRAYARASGG